MIYNGILSILPGTMMDCGTYLETVEASSFCSLNFIGEPFKQIFVDNAIRGSKEGEYMRDEVLGGDEPRINSCLRECAYSFIVAKLVFPVVHVFRQIHLFGRPK